MSDYTQVTDFSAKDALSSGDPEKTILGSDVDVELAAIATAIATKADDSAVVHDTGTETVAGDKTFSGNNTHSGTQTVSGATTHSGLVTMSGKSIYAAEGAAVASAASCNIWLGDGNTRHITGTTQIDGFATAPQAGVSQLLIFDDALILNQSANLNLNGGGADITTAAGDIAIVYADTTAQMDVFVIPADGQPVIGYPASQGSSWVLIAPPTTNGEVTGMDGTYDQYVFVASGMTIQNDAQEVNLQVGDSGGYKTTLYQYHVGVMSAGSATYASYNSGSDTDIQIAASMGNASGEVMTFALFIDSPSSATLKKLIHGKGCFLDSAGVSIGVTVFGNWNGGVENITKIKVFPASGSITGGNFYLYGVKKA
jgi:hypothetical protein